MSIVIAAGQRGDSPHFTSALTSFRLRRPAGVRACGTAFRMVALPSSVSDWQSSAVACRGWPQELMLSVVGQLRPGV